MLHNISGWRGNNSYAKEREGNQLIPIVGSQKERDVPQIVYKGKTSI